jgi:hypothetical protein
MVDVRSSSANVIEPPARTDRDERGCFPAGNSGGGRDNASRNKHFETSLETIAKDLGCASAQAKPAVSGHKTAAIIKASTGTMVFVQTTGRPPALPESHKAGIVAQGTKV